MSSRPDCTFEIHQLWQSGFSRMHSNCCCHCSFEPEIIEIDQSSHKMYSNNIVNFQESTTILNAYTKKSGNLFNAPRTKSEGILSQKSAKNFSMRFRLEPFEECIETLIVLSSKYFVANGSLSGWNVQWHFTDSFRILCFLLFLKIPKYYYLSMVPCTPTSFPAPETAKDPKA